MDLHETLYRPVVAVPAKDEEQRLPLLLEALARQSWHRRTKMPLPVVVVLNNCTDGTMDAARIAARTLPEIALELIEIEYAPEDAHVGSARRLAMDRALALSRTEGRGVILTTDADAVPNPDWVDANLRAIEGGADLVGGKLIGNREEEARFGPGFAARAAAVAEYATLRDRLASLIDPSEHDPWPRHQDHTGGSLAISAEVYEAVGGLPVLPLREDLALVSRVRAAGGKLVHPLYVRVEVSARLAGRARGGMADCLKAWLRAEAEGSPILVEDPARWRDRLLRRAAIRRSSGRVAAQLGGLGQIDAGAADRCNRLAALAALVEHEAPDEPDAPSDMNVAIATPLICEMIEAIEETSRAA